jgi:hypothetical protein
MQAEINYSNEVNYDCLKEGGLVCNFKDASIENLPRSLNGAAEDEQHSCETSEFVGSQLVPVEGPQSQEHVLAVHSETLKIDQKDGQSLGPYEIFVTSPQLRTEVGVALIDTGAQDLSSLGLRCTPRLPWRKIGYMKLEGLLGI